MMAKPASSLANILESMCNEPQQTVVQALLREGSLDSLSEMKMVMLQACQQHDNFPKGELYRRRRPRCGSAFATLEERLANDIIELNEFLDTGIVTSEIRAMFKPDSKVCEEVVSTNTVSTSVSGENTPNNTSNKYQSSSCSPLEVGTATPLAAASPLNKSRSSGWTGLSTQLSSLHSEYLLFREKVSADILHMLDKIDDLINVVKCQDDEIASLKDVNSKLVDRVNTLEGLQVHDQCKTLSKNAIVLEQKIDELDGIVKIQGHSITELKDGNIVLHKCLINKNSGLSDSPTSVCLSPNLNSPVAVGSDELCHGSDGASAASQDVLTTVDVAAGANGGSAAPCAGSVGVESGEVMGGANPIATNNNTGFTNVKRRQRTKAFFVGGIDEQIHPDVIVHFLNRRGINPTLVKLLRSRRQGTVSAKVNVHAVHARAVLGKFFWPNGVYCRPWVPLTQMKMERKT